MKQSQFSYKAALQKSFYERKTFCWICQTLQGSWHCLNKTALQGLQTTILKFAIKFLKHSCTFCLFFKVRSLLLLPGWWILTTVNTFLQCCLHNRTLHHNLNELSVCCSINFSMWLNINSQKSGIKVMWSIAALFY